MKRIVLFCAVLLLAQLAMASHAIEHAFADHAEACVECLALPGLQAIPAQAPVLPPQLATYQDTPLTVLPASTFARFLPFRSRAPPLLPSC